MTDLFYKDAPNQTSRRADRLVLAPAARRDAVLELIRSAKRNLVLSVFRCDDLSIVDELATAVNRGVHVRVLITQRARGWKERLKDLTALLRSLGADVRPYESSTVKYHAKYIVADNGRALVTSLNFTRKCFENTCDFLVFSEDPEVIETLIGLFETDCQTSSGSPVHDVSPRLIIGPEHSRQRLTQMLAGAASSIQIIDHRVTDSGILTLLAEKRHQGVKVQVVGSSRKDGLICHGRMILIDEKTAVIGSIHLSGPSLDLRREVAIVLAEPGQVAELYDYFRNLANNEANLLDLWSTPLSAQTSADDEEDE